MRHDFSGLTHRAERYFPFLPRGFRPRWEVFYNSFVPLFPRVPYVLEEAVRGTLAATNLKQPPQIRRCFSTTASCRNSSRVDSLKNFTATSKEGGLVFLVEHG